MLCILNVSVHWQIKSLCALAETKWGGGRSCCADDRMEVLSASCHHPDPLTDRVYLPRALHHLQPNKPCPQMCSRTPKYICKTCSGAKAYSVLGTDLTLSGPAARQLLNQRVGSFKKCHVPQLRAIVRHRGAGREPVGSASPSAAWRKDRAEQQGLLHYCIRQRCVSCRRACRSLKKCDFGP